LGLAAVFAFWAGCASPPQPAAPGEVARPNKAVEKPAPATGISFEDRVEANARFIAGMAFELREERERALEEFYRAALADWANETLVSDVGRRLLAARQADKAVEVLAKSAQRRDTSPPVLALLGYAYRETGQTAKAIAANREALRKAPDFLPAHQNLIQIHLAEKRPEDARKVLDEAARAIAAEKPDQLLALAETHNFYLRSQPADASAIRPRVIELLQKVSAQNPTAPPLLARLAEAYFHVGEYGRASGIYLDLLARVPNLPGLRERLIDAYIRNQDWKLASEQLETIIRNNPSNANAYLVLSGIAYEEKQFDRAAEYLEKALLFRPDMEQAYYDLAGLKINAKKAPEALALLARARQQFTNEFQLEFYTGLAHSQLKQYSEALRHFTAAEVVARAHEPQRLTHFFYFQLGAASERNKDHEQAESYFRKCLEMAPDFSEALNYLGYMWAERGVNLQEARRLIEKAVKLEPDNAAYIDSMAWVLFKLKDPKAALEWQLKALKHNDEPDATLYDHLGDIYDALNRPEQAREAWKKSLEIESNDEVRKKLEPATRPQTE
jgi:tetratricopeptide (TPR) repeat protein